MTTVVDLDARPVTFEGSAVARRLLALGGWRVVFDGLPALQGVIVVYPHTSNWDFVVALLAKWGIGVPVRFWGKHSLFTVPLWGRLMRRVGGIPVVRNQSLGVVRETVTQIQHARDDGTLFWLALAPEGTRSAGAAWRSGFYHVALQADVPLGVGFIDYATRTVGVEHFVHLTGDVPADMARIAALLVDRRGLRPARATPVRLASDAARGDVEGAGTWSSAGSPQ